MTVPRPSKYRAQPTTVDGIRFASKRKINEATRDGSAPSKYRAEPTTVDGIRFASKREAARYRELRLMEQAGHIRGLELQPRYPMVVNGLTVCVYVADFRYVAADGRAVVEDVKGVRTPAYVIKSKLLKALHGVEVSEVK